MKIFRDDKIELTRSDWNIVAAYVTIMCIWLGYRFYVEGIDPAKAFFHILNSAVEVLASFFAIKVIVELFFLRYPNRLLGLTFIVSALIIIGGIGLIAGAHTDGYQLTESIFPVGQFIVNSLNNSLFDVALLIGFVFSKKSYDQLINNKNLAIENRNNTLKVLRSQFSPHFLFNNLNTIDALIDDRPAVAKRYVAHLASLYRYLTQTIDQDIVPLEAELAFIRDYLFLIEVRYGDDYKFSVRIEQETDGLYLPSGALQTVVENVVKHNAIDTRQIVTELTVASGSVVVQNMKGLQSSKTTTGKGVRNLVERYRLLGTEVPTISNLVDTYRIELPLIQVQAL